MTILLGLAKDSAQHPSLSPIPLASLGLPVHRSSGHLHGGLVLLQSPLRTVTVLNHPTHRVEP